MGAKQSSASTNNNSKQHHNSKHSKHLLTHPVIIHGLSGSGQTTVEECFNIPEQRKLNIAQQFLTQPPIYTTEMSGMFYGSGVKADSAIWSYGGRGSIRPRWSMAAVRTKAILFTVDSTNCELMTPRPDQPPLPREFVAGYIMKSPRDQREILATLLARQNARDMLHRLVALQLLSHKPLLILATKQDQPGAMSVEEIAEALQLNAICNRDWHIAGVNALTGEGMAESLDWLNYAIANPTPKTELKPFTPLYDQLYSEPKVHWNWYSDPRRIRGNEVVKAPPLFKTNGELFQPTAEQVAGFVVAPLTEEKDLAPKVHSTPIAPPLTLTSEQLGTSSPSLSSPSTNDSAPASDSYSAPASMIRSDSHVSIESATESEGGSESDSDESVKSDDSNVADENTPSLGDMKKFLDGAKNVELVAVVKSSGTSTNFVPFQSLSSRPVVMPNRSTIPTVGLREKKVRAHWYSIKKKKSVMVPDQQDLAKIDIHAQDRWEFRYSEIMGLM